MSSSNCCFLTCIQVSQEAGQVVWYSHLFQNSPQFIVIHTDKGFGIVNKAEIDVFLELSCFFDDRADVGNLISGSSAFSKTSLNIWKFTVDVLLKPGLENFEETLNYRNFFFSCQTETLYSLTNASWFLISCSSCQSLPMYASMCLTTLDISCTWYRIAFVFLCLDYFTYIISSSFIHGDLFCTVLLCILATSS